MRTLWLPLAVFAAALFVGASVGRALPDQKPGSVRYFWTIHWPAKGHDRVFIKEFRAPPGLMRHVTVVIAGKAVASPPNLSPVGCLGTGHDATAQKNWLWNGRSVFVTLLLSPGQCAVAEGAVRVQVTLKSVGT